MQLAIIIISISISISISTIKSHKVNDELIVLVWSDADKFRADHILLVETFLSELDCARHTDNLV